MKINQLRDFWRNPFTVAIFAGILLALAFPRVGIAGFAWIAPGLLALAGLGKRGWESFRIGYASGLAYYLVSLNWLLRIPYRWIGIPLGPALGLLALSAFLSIYPGVWVWSLSLGQGNGSSTSANPEPNSSGILAWGRGTAALSAGWSRRFAWALTGAAAWVALEMCVARLLSGFPWDLLGVSQYRMVPLIQIASVTGVYGVSFIVAWTSLCLLLAALAVLQRPALRYAWLSEVILPLIAIGALFVFGLRQMRKPDQSSQSVRVSLDRKSVV